MTCDVNYVSTHVLQWSLSDDVQSDPSGIRRFIGFFDSPFDITRLMPKSCVFTMSAALTMEVL